ncbi:putative aminoacyltransferase, E1 ubiquitin-activating enzyme [Medicago truncatula]|uniref:Putative aminoacyltransferase, E1 ubiquitin-activating enzyme n=1 Tax=Medicago truncatula TaxID=3880 RepID=Q2HSK9_MEDTR|nr:putative ubiquitin-conjugating enzyme E2 38 [Medicago truncatula]ABD32474.2 Ubiquitin-conjugating enzyme, E2 [Medicago truncatula]KEH22433.1 ubiquitin-conjugating enzyme [Medicago truncatula]KEH22508.1 ubiquitin-conjugating enzyme [Medicago truncatula]RHN45646.1 putative aminoacyltransferase, E1 ubiquitin-activating enzyme [Medicago truncatula]
MEKMNNKFDLVSDDSDHKYRLDNIGGNCFSNTRSSIYKRIMKEWKILEKNLPDSIYVRAYESRIDLLRAVIVGAAGTPYHDGLFFFDIQFPSDYPNIPPKIHYHSFGYSLNPNLYPNGMVCLSLLNTYVGEKCEKWDPSSSTILQVLVSIQGLVLNEKPLFNAPFYRVFKRSFHEKKSRDFIEDTFVRTCYTIVNLIRKPPKNFEVFVKEHFRERGHVLLAACREYVNGRLMVGYYNYNNKQMASSSSSTSMTGIKVRESFQKSLQSAYGNMYKQFIKCGASVEGFLQELELEEQGKDRSKSKSKRSNGGSRIFKKAMGKIKLALGLKKK